MTGTNRWIWVGALAAIAIVGARGAHAQSAEPSAPDEGSESAPGSEPATAPPEAAAADPAASPTPAAPPPAAAPSAAPAAAAMQATESTSESAAATAPERAAERSLESPSAEEDEITDDESDVAWRAALEWDQTYNAAGLTRGGEQSWNPEYAWSFTAALGYAIDDKTALTLRQPWAIELTDSDSTNTRQEWWLLDTSFTLSRKLLRYEPSTDHALEATGSARMIFPTSKQSQARTMILGARGALGGRYTYERVLRGISAGLDFSYLRRFTSSNTSKTETSFPCFRTGSDVSENCTHLGGSSVTADLFVLGLSGGLAITEALDVGLDFSMGWNRGLGFDPVTVATSTGDVTVEDDSTTHWRNTRSIGLSVGYAFTDWLSATAHVDNEFSEIENGERRDPFQAVDTQLGLALEVSFDQLYVQTQR